MSIQNPFEEQLPSAPEVERGVLGAILLDNQIIIQALRWLKPEDFYVPSHRRIFVAMTALFERHVEINPILISEELKKEGSVESVGGMVFITNLTYGLPISSSIEHYCLLLIEKAETRRFIRILYRYIVEAVDESDDPQNLFAEAATAIKQLQTKSAAKTDGGGSYAEIDVRFREQMTQVKRNEIIAYPTGLIPVDLQIHGGGALPGNLVGIAGLSSDGKSALAIQICEYNARLGRRTAYFSYENSDVEIYTRSVGPQALVQVSHIGPGLDEYRMGMVERALPEVSILPIHVYTHPKFRSVDKAWEKVRELKEEGKRIDLVVFDNMKQLNGRGSGIRFSTTVEELAYVCGRTKAGAREENCAAVILAHFNSQGYKDKFPSWDNINGGQSLRDESDLAMTIWTAKDEKGESLKTAKLQIAKQRMGARDLEFDLQFDTRTMRFIAKEG